MTIILQTHHKIKNKQNKTESNKKAQTTKDNHQLSPEKNLTDAFEWSKYY